MASGPGPVAALFWQQNWLRRLSGFVNAKAAAKVLLDIKGSMLNQGGFSGSSAN
jgi:hypothetical protein